MAAYALISRTVILGTVWTGTAPGPGVATPAGTVATVLDCTPYLVDGGDLASNSNMLEATTMSSLGYSVMIPGLTSGDDLVLTMSADEAASSLAVGIRTLGGVARPATSPIYVDTKPTSASRSATNPSSVAAVYIKKWSPRAGSVGNKSVAQLTLCVSGTFLDLMA